MKVRELIQHLQQHDPDLDVELYYFDEPPPREIVSVYIDQDNLPQVLLLRGRS